ncbi:DUF397 domain-containing protein [Streptosporangium sp. NPDC006930]|uniref:DUF397 domain-containing protein n=1 Tax=Streptosporangium sp. NPDC006930 TaxID=3154783 RepID=UPI00342DFCC9
MTWRKSSQSNANGGQCVEVGVWHKSTPSGSRIEVALTDNTQVAHAVDTEGLFLLRDSKDPDGPVLSFTAAEWDALLVSIKRGSLADLA